MFLGKFLYTTHYYKICLERLHQRCHHLASSGLFADRTSKSTSLQRTPRDEADAMSVTIGDHLALLIARRKNHD